MAAQEYPITLKNVLVVTVDFARKPEMPHQLEVSITAEVKVVFDAKFPDRMQANLRLKSVADAPLHFLVEVVGLYEYLSEEARTNRDLQIRFLEDRGLFMLWPIASQLVKMITSLMGIAPLEVAYPTQLDLASLEIHDR